MTEPENTELPSLADLISPERAEELKDLSPGISWALDSLVISFREELGKLEKPARDAFVRLTLDYGKYLERFLRLAHKTVSEEEKAQRNSRMENLRGLDLFNGLNEFDLGQIAGAFETKIYERGESFIREGELGKAVYFLSKGQVGIFAGGNQVAVRGKGNLFGEMSCLTNTPASATLRTVTDCEVLVISKEDFEEFVLKLPEIVPQFARMGVSRLGDITNRLSEVLSHMPDALLKLGMDNVITGDVSSKCFQYLERDVLTGEVFPELIFKDHPEQIAEWKSAFTKLCKQPELLKDPNFPIPNETTFKLKSGETRFYLVNLHPTYEGGRHSGFDVAISDYTEQKEVEEERARMERALHNVVHKYLSFQLAGETFGINIEQAREILDRANLTKVPNAPPFLKGVFNLRGRIIPAVDLKTLLQLPQSEEESSQSLLLVDLKFEGGTKLVGMVVDSVTDILDIPDREIEPPPALGLDGSTGFIQGLAKVEGKVRLLLDLENLLSLEEQRQVHRVATTLEARLEQKKA